MGAKNSRRAPDYPVWVSSIQSAKLSDLSPLGLEHQIDNFEMHNNWQTSI